MKRLSGLLQQPYRPFFLAGALYAFVTLAFWFIWRETLRAGFGLAIPWTVAPARAHAVVMIWGVLTFYVFGFLLTAYVRWVAASEPPKAALVGWLAALVVGQLLFVSGALGAGSLLVPGALVSAVAQISLAVFLGRALLRSNTQERLQPRVVLIALCLSVIGLLLSAVGLTRDGSGLYVPGLLLGLYGYLLLMITAVGHRLIPFFTVRVLGGNQGRRWGWTLPLVLALLALRIVVFFMPVTQGVLRAGAGIDAGLFLVLARDVTSWQPGRALRNPMILVLYVAIFWVLVALGASAFSLLQPGGPLRVDPLVLHALTVGGFSTLVLGISTRVALGHAGRPIVADGWILLAFGMIFVAALVRAVAPLLGGAAPQFVHWAAIPWCLAFGIWLLRIGPLLFEVRVKS